MSPNIQSITKQMCCPIYPLNLITTRDINNRRGGLHAGGEVEIGSLHVTLVTKYVFLFLFCFFYLPNLEKEMNSEQQLLTPR